MGERAGLRRLAVLAACALAAVLAVSAAHAGTPARDAIAARDVAAAPAAKSAPAAASVQQLRRFRRGVWVPVPPAPGLLLARVVVTLKKPAKAAARSGEVAGFRPQKPVIVLRNRKLLPSGFGATGSIWRGKARNRFIAAVAFTSRTNNSFSSGERVYLEVRANQPIGKLGVRWERLRARELVTRRFGKCLFSLVERARARHFVKRIGGRLPEAYNAREVATAVTAADCGSVPRDFLDEVGFPSSVAGAVGDSGGGSGSGGEGGSGGSSGGGDGTPGGGSGGGGGDPGGSGGGGDGSGGGGADTQACDGIAASSGLPREYILAITCDDDWNTLTVARVGGVAWTSADSLDAAGSCTTPGGAVSCTLDHQSVQALVLTSAADVPVGATLTATVGGLPGGATQVVRITVEAE